jgi:hypothetical protein
LNREPDAPGLSHWVNGLIDNSLCGAEVAYGFVFSREMLDKNLSDEAFLLILYRAFFDRDPDAGGWDGWLGLLSSAPTGDRSTREYVLDGFLYSQEFEQLCNGYGIIPY